MQQGRSASASAVSKPEPQSSRNMHRPRLHGLLAPRQHAPLPVNRFELQGGTRYFATGCVSTTAT